jgi:hypothetical protein
MYLRSGLRCDGLRLHHADRPVCRVGHAPRIPGPNRIAWTTDYITILSPFSAAEIRVLHRYRPAIAGGSVCRVSPFSMLNFNFEQFGTSIVVSQTRIMIEMILKQAKFALG